MPADSVLARKPNNFLERHLTNATLITGQIDHSEDEMRKEPKHIYVRQRAVIDDRPCSCYMQQVDHLNASTIHTYFPTKKNKQRESGGFTPRPPKPEVVLGVVSIVVQRQCHLLSLSCINCFFFFPLTILKPSQLVWTRDIKRLSTQSLSVRFQELQFHSISSTPAL